MGKRVWSIEDVEILKATFSSTLNSELEEKIGKKLSTIKNKAKKMGLKRDKEIVKIECSLSKKGDKNPNWKNGIKHHSKGYIYVLTESHPNLPKDKYMAYHRLIMENEIGRILEPSEIVHHKNEVKDDNELKNLVVMEASEHCGYHSKKRKSKK